MTRGFKSHWNTMSQLIKHKLCMLSSSCIPHHLASLWRGHRTMCPFNYSRAIAPELNIPIYLLIDRINLRSIGARSRAVIFAHLFVSKDRSSFCERSEAWSASFSVREPEVRVGRSYRTGHSCARYVCTSVCPSVLNSVLYFAFRNIYVYAVRAPAVGVRSLMITRIRTTLYCFL